MKRQCMQALPRRAMPAALAFCVLVVLFGGCAAEMNRFGAILTGSEAPTYRRKTGMPSDPWAEVLEDQGREAHASMNAWLEQFFASTPAEDLHPAPPLVPEVKSRGFSLPPRQVTTYTENISDAHVWTNWNSTESCSAFLAAAPRPHRRRNLIIAPVGSDFDASRWMTHPDHATYDIVALYYGSQPDFECPLCRAVIKAGGTKWYLMNSFMRRNASLWAQMASEYSALMIADDDLEWDTCILNRAFEIFSSYGLLLAQPSLCRTSYRSSYWAYLYQNPSTVLRYITFVEIMAPMYDMKFFQGLVGPSLWNAYTGWGLDFTWPFLLRYPRKHIAVIDDVCMTHAAPVGGKTGEGDLYSVPVPYSEREEETRRVGEFAYYQSRVESMGLPYRNMETMGMVMRTYVKKEDLPLAGGPSVALDDLLPFGSQTGGGGGSGGAMLVSVGEAVGVASLAVFVLGVALVRQRMRRQQRNGGIVARKSLSSFSRGGSSMTGV